jgi:hypothetical protein
MPDLQQEIEKIEASGALGRSSVYARLLRYLNTVSARAKPPKEADIAAEVFNRVDFDPGSDSSVRVYVHKLRQKLDNYYATDAAGAAERITIPKGEYRVRFGPVERPPRPVGSRKASPWRIAAMGLMFFSLLSVVWSGLSRLDSGSDVTAFRSTEFWGPILRDDKQVFLVVGDYFVFAEVDDAGNATRLVRDFAVNSSDDFEAMTGHDPQRDDQYRDIELSYLPVGAGAALGDVLRVLHSTSKSVRILPASRFRTSLLREGHIVYVGYLSGLGNLANYAFSASRLTLGMSYDELVDIKTGETYRSDAGWMTDSEASYTDYGWLATFAGPADNRVVIVAGTRDEALMHVATVSANLDEIKALSNSELLERRRDNFAIEALYQVNSRDRTHVASRRIFSSMIDDQNIWLEQSNR